ncbi:MAG: hypothetical protein EBU96_08265 [Actinobacteria bacterium]|nr:hypothetical protein [Actinomycetota bacterium]
MEWSIRNSGGKVLVIASKIHPVGDFDFGLPSLNEPHRAYKTLNGFRVFYTGIVGGSFMENLAKVSKGGSDRNYELLHAGRGVFTARVTPKANINEDACQGKCVAKLLFEIGKRKPEWDEFIKIHDAWTNALGEGILV